MAITGLLGWVRRPRQFIAAGLIVGTALLAASALVATAPDVLDGVDVVRGGVQWARRAAVEVTPADDAERETALAASVDLWSDSPDARTVTIVVDGAGRAALDAAGIGFTEIVPDIDAVAAAERARLAQPTAQKPRGWFAEYKRFESVNNYLDTIAAVRPDLAAVERIGSSLEGRPIRAIRISNAGPQAPAFVINGGQHAREWISVMTTTCLADRLVRRAQTDAAVSTLLDQMQVYIVPVANPDGYAYSWDSDRYWRKNRRDGHGVDLNRNYPLAFGRKGSSNQKASPIYRGTHPFSEPESEALRDLVRRLPVELHIDFHSFSQLLLYPWSHTGEAAPDKRRLKAQATAMAGAIKATHGKKYDVIDGASLYPASGTMLDWVYGETQASSFVVELRPRRGDGFVLPPDQIVPTCDESLAAVLALARHHQGNAAQ